MYYQSILFETADDSITTGNGTMPEYFIDLNLDQIIQEILAGKEEYNLKGFFCSSLKSISAIHYRLEIMKELDREQVRESMVNFSGKMKRIREYVGFSQEAHNLYQRQKWLLDAVCLYCDTVLDLHRSLIRVDLSSKGLRQFNNWLTEYVKSDRFKILHTDTEDLYRRFAGIRYSVQIEKDRVVVDIDDSQEDYCTSVNKSFENINEAAFDYQIKFFTGFEMCVLENKILEIVRRMNIEAFERLELYCEKHRGFLDRSVASFDREIQFYISYLEYIDKLKLKGHPFAYPDISASKTIEVAGGYDLALAYKSLASGKDIITNDFSLNNEERIYILTGPNQGGKTTFARAFGQILFLASIGCPVPCKKAKLFLYDKIFTHFSVEENLSTNAGRLKEELVRLKAIMEAVTTSSVIIVNELFATTTSYDAYTMGKKVLDHFIALDCICLYVTHIHELALISKKTVSLIAAVHSGRDAARTYKIFRKPADGLAYANSIVDKYSLSYSQIKERIRI